jgi:hypothetical protein
MGGLQMAYFLAGGRAREPEVNWEAYSSFFLTRFSWIGVWGAIVWFEVGSSLRMCSRLRLCLGEGLLFKRAETKDIFEDPRKRTK